MQWSTADICVYVPPVKYRLRIFFFFLGQCVMLLFFYIYIKVVVYLLLRVQRSYLYMYIVGGGSFDDLLNYNFTLFLTPFSTVHPPPRLATRRIPLPELRHYRHANRTYIGKRRKTDNKQKKRRINLTVGILWCTNTVHCTRSHYNNNNILCSMVFFFFFILLFTSYK